MGEHDWTPRQRALAVLARVLATALLAAGATGRTALAASARPAPSPSTGEWSSAEAPRTLDTGVLPAPSAGEDVVAAFHVHEPGATWLRLFFERVELPGGARLRLTGLEDGVEQVLDASEVEAWSRSSAYFNGDLVLVEVIAVAGAGPARVVLEKVRFGVERWVLPSLCGGDEREASSDPSVARLMPSGCTGFLIDDDCGCLLTAGHCMGASSIVQFNVPASSPTGALRHPAPEHQYAVDPDSVQGNGGQGPGDDWAYFGVERNATSGATAREVQGRGRALASPAWSSGRSVRVTGYGIDAAEENQVQQTSTGDWLSASGSLLEYATDTMGGNSGSPVIDEASAAAMGIHTHGGCQTPTAGNRGTSLSHAGLAAALADPQGVCRFRGVAGSLAARNGSGMNPACLDARSVPLLGTVWELEVDARQRPGAIATLTLCRTGAASGVFLPLGELLVDLASPHAFRTVLPTVGGVDVHRVLLPTDPALAGRTATVQAAVVGGASASLCNALDFALGCDAEACLP